MKKLLYMRSNENISEELLYYDEGIYNSVKFLLTDTNIDWDNEEFYFVVMDDEGQEIELVPDGKNKRVNAKNKA